MSQPLVTIVNTLSRLITRLKCKMACCYQSSCSVEPAEPPADPTDNISTMQVDEL